MLRSLYAGVSGMRSFQTKMDVIANNIANVNTTAFKSGRVSFQDMLSQTTANASGPTENGLGGTNARQVGLGVKVGGIDTIMTGGSLQPTNRGLDFAIEGEGFFTVTDGTRTLYTRDGAFYTDYEGNLVNSNGFRVMGYREDEFVDIDEDGNFDRIEDYADQELVALQIPEFYDGDEEMKLQDFTIDETGQIIAIYGNGEDVQACFLGQIAMTTFQNPEGLTKQGSNNYSKSNNSGEPAQDVAGGPGVGLIRQGYLEMSNVDLASEFTEMIVTSRAFQANSRSITTSDEMLQELINLKR